MPVVNGKKYPYTAEGKAAAKRAAAKPAVKIIKKGEPTPRAKTPMPKKTTATPKPRGGTPLPKKTTKPDSLYKTPLKPNKNWRKAPSDADVIIPGYNDPATIRKMNQKAKKK